MESTIVSLGYIWDGGKEMETTIESWGYIWDNGSENGHYYSSTRHGDMVPKDHLILKRVASCFGRLSNIIFSFSVYSHP